MRVSITQWTIVQYAEWIRYQIRVLQNFGLATYPRDLEHKLSPATL
jgi:hypothetical protein